jgi:putative intracellular protease/amidase
VVGAICIAPTILARAGLLTDLDATAFPTERDELIRGGAHFVADPVVGAGRVFTANGPGSAELFGWRLAAALDGDAEAARRT